MTKTYQKKIQPMKMAKSIKKTVTKDMKHKKIKSKSPYPQTKTKRCN